jgi:hypothetical protein
VRGGGWSLLTCEVTTLSRLSHRHVVRYYQGMLVREGAHFAAWVECFDAEGVLLADDDAFDSNTLRSDSIFFSRKGSGTPTTDEPFTRESDAILFIQVEERGGGTDGFRWNSASGRCAMLWGKQILMCTWPSGEGLKLARVCRTSTGRASSIGT